MGYIGFSMSERAAEAREAGLRPASEWAKCFGVPTQAVREICVWEEWHHTSSQFNKTYFYSREEIERNIEALKAWRPAEGPWEGKALVTWLEWSGSRRHPKCERIQAPCLVKFNGKSTYTITRLDEPKARPFQKRKGTNGLKIERS